MVVTALAAGLLFGYAAQRGGFCLMRALSNLVLMGDTSVMRAYALALAVAVVAVQALQASGVVEPLPVRPLQWLANLAGGLLFGIGMVLGGGCAGSSWYRLGEGALGAWVVLLGFALGASATAVGLLRPLRQALQQPEILVDEGPPTLAALVGLSPWIVVAVLAVAGALTLLRGQDEGEHGKWRWPVTGLVMGLVITLGWYLSDLGGSPAGITFAANTGEILSYPMVGYPNRLRWGMVMVAGVAGGSFLAAWRHGQFGWKAVPGFTGVKLFAGGLVMGIGALVAGGCNVTQGLTNAATLSAGSFLAFGAMLAGGWATLRLLYGR
jgi:uncharacterized membrane protein YedE/YeeE